MKPIPEMTDDELLYAMLEVTSQTAGLVRDVVSDLLVIPPDAVADWNNLSDHWNKLFQERVKRLEAGE